MGSDTLSGLPLAENVKEYDGGPIVGEEGAVTSIIESFDLFYPVTLIKLITKKKNQRAAIISSSYNPPNLLLNRVHSTFLECYEFIVVLLFIYYFSLTSEKYYLSTNLLGKNFVPDIIPRKRFSHTKA